MVYNPFEVLRHSEGMCREIWGILENNAERPDLADWFQDVRDPDIIIVRTCSVSSRTIKAVCAAGYFLHVFGADNGVFDMWISKLSVDYE